MALNAKLWTTGPNAKLQGNDEWEYALVWRVDTTLDPQIIKLEEVS